MKTTRTFKSRSLILVSALSVGLGFLSPAFGQQHTSYLVDPNGGVTQVGDLATTAIAINDTGQVLGVGSPPGFELSGAFITGPNGAGMNFPFLPKPKFAPHSLNDAGQVAGEDRLAVDESQAFVTGPNGHGVTYLGSLGVGGWFTSANDINDSGQVVGYDDTYGAGREHAFITNGDGHSITDLRTLGGFSSTANGINNAGQVVGWSDTVAGAQHAFITGPSGAGMTDLGTLGGPDSSSYATGINDTGQVAGYFETPGGGYHAFVTGPNGLGMTDLGTLGGPHDSSFATGINNAGEVVGFFGNDAQVNGSHVTAGSHSHAFVTGLNGEGMTDLNSLVNLTGGQVLKEAVGINNAGQIIANGSVSTIPEPESYALVLAGLGLLAAVVRCRDMRKTF